MIKIFKTISTSMYITFPIFISFLLKFAVSACINQFFRFVYLCIALHQNRVCKANPSWNNKKYTLDSFNLTIFYYRNIFQWILSNTAKTTCSIKDSAISWIWRKCTCPCCQFDKSLTFLRDIFLFECISYRRKQTCFLLWYLLSYYVSTKT